MGLPIGLRCREQSEIHGMPCLPTNFQQALPPTGRRSAADACGCDKEGSQPGEHNGGLREMGTLRCDGCAEEFVVNHQLTLVDNRLAEKQASWRERVLADDHDAIRSIPTESNCQTDNGGRRSVRR